MTCVCSYLYYKNLKVDKSQSNEKKENNIDKYLTKELINYSKYSLHNLSLTQLPNNFISNANI